MEASRREPGAETRQANALREQLESQKASLEVQAAGLQTKDRLLREAIARTEQQLAILNARLASGRGELGRLTREVAAAGATFSTLSPKLTDAVVAEGIKGGFVRVVDRAVASRLARGTVTKVGLAAVVGLTLGIFLALLLDRFAPPVPGRVQPAALPISPDPHRAKEREA